MNDVAICMFAYRGYDPTAQGLAAAGRRTLVEAGGKLIAIVVGSRAGEMAKDVAAVADSVLVADMAELSEYQPEICLNVLTTICSDLNPRAVLLGNDTYSQELAPR